MAEPGVVVHTCIPSTGETEANKPVYTAIPYSKKKYHGKSISHLLNAIHLLIGSLLCKGKYGL
jgi:hypothetical protein